jgi:DNA invertase Pin-like site-specific DNA recombinase
MVYDKITPSHLQRNAYLYVRQSTLRQVVENTESTQRQYALQQRAIALGWTQEQITIIDDDLGKSGASTAREGFRKLVTEVSLGHAGIVMGLEVSRLARNSSDWHRLLEICALSGTLILDEEGTYDPAHFNDRLLLGLKGTMSEAELHVIRARLTGGLLNKAKRGELKMRLPVGFVYNAVDKVVLDPDKRVQETIAMLFNTFRRVGTVGATVKEFERLGVLFPKRLHDGPRKGELVYSALTPRRTFEILKNPRYAGAYAYGLRQQFPRGLEQKPLTKFVERDQWKAFLKEAHPGYIRWEDYEENVRRLQANANCTKDNRRCPPREGPALLQGLAVCGLCGRRMTVRYHTRRGKRASPDYTCRCPNTIKHCQSIPGDSIDALIGAQLIEKISPETLEMALAVHDELQKRIAEADKLRYRHVEQARYEMELAKRRYMAVDPSHRLVADELEAEWNQKIRAYKSATADYEQKREADRIAISDEQKMRIHTLVTDFPTLWNATTTEDKDRKRMVRLLIEDVTLIKSDHIEVKIRYKGGQTAEHTLDLPQSAWIEKKHAPEVLAAIDELLEDHTDGEVAELLNQKGYRSGTGKSFCARRVSQIRRAYRIASYYTRLRKRGLLTIKEICEIYDITRWTVYDWRNSGKLKANRYDDVGRYLYELISA